MMAFRIHHSMMGLLYLSLGGGVVLDRKDAEDTVAEQDQAAMSS